MFLLIFLVAITVQHYDELGIFWIEWMNDIKSYKKYKTNMILLLSSVLFL